eukprot:6184025-Pleurochrysis_carterae.AAC.1
MSEPRRRNVPDDGDLHISGEMKLEDRVRKGNEEGSRNGDDDSAGKDGGNESRGNDGDGED